jgi:DNA modification methylase
MPMVFPDEMLAYRTPLGQQLAADSRQVLPLLPPDSVDLVLTSPPFALLREKSYGNETQAQYVDWLAGFAREVMRVLKPTGSFVLDLGGAYQRGRPVRSLYNFRVLIRFCDEIGFRLAQEFFWYNPAKLPSPIEWVNKRKIRAKDAVNTVWWFSKTDFPKADVSQVLVPYSARMESLLAEPSRHYRPKERPSGHDIGSAFERRNEGAIPSNLLQIPNTSSNSQYLRACKALGRRPHPARFPSELPSFFIRFLTDPQDLVVDIFSGSNTTGYVAEELGRHWLSIDSDPDYAALSALRFMEALPTEEMKDVLAKIEANDAADLPSPFPQLSFHQSRPSTGQARFASPDDPDYTTPRLGIADS